MLGAKWAFLSPHNAATISGAGSAAESALPATPRELAAPALLIPLCIVWGAERMRTTAVMSDRNNASDTMSPPNDSGSNAKRKSEDGGPQPRAKRNRYISIAWYVTVAHMTLACDCDG